ncbi:PREDICTED: uncharacterized protein LOC107344996 [Acropora digitifera]|uniref:uncharacterized protein LOC107344996 n=1 Tax=Acropora digitifera TaxID=70779 RepID=UPI00077A313B|nr:PREDICTED: uncharacterized protein LOC107344996 [Acropora digitifera]
MLFFGRVFSEKGMLPDPKKVEALQNVTPPTNAPEVRSLLSSAAFCSRFIKDFALITRPLRQLTCDGTRWQWTYDVQSEEHNSFVARNATPKEVTLFEIESATAKDSMLRAAMSAVKSGYWYKASPPISLPEQSRYEQVKEQLTCTDTVLLKSDRLVIPATLQERIVGIAHEVLSFPSWISCFPFGAPPVVKSENGPPFNEEEFAKFACVLGFKHQKVTPLWPRASGKVERFVKTLKKCIKAEKVEVRNWRKEKQAILRNYRTTPHATTGVAPAGLQRTQY